MTPETSKPDCWTVWFFRLVQVCGVLSLAHEVLLTTGTRPWLLLASYGMMLGGYGMTIVLHALAKRS